MDIGDIVIYGGTRFTVRGLDPMGVDPRFLYLEDASTGKTISVVFEERSPGITSNGLRLVEDNSPENSQE